MAAQGPGVACCDAGAPIVGSRVGLNLAQMVAKVIQYRPMHPGDVEVPTLQAGQRNGAGYNAIGVALVGLAVKPDIC
jgi:hypothetical protein